jgi:hypothetical protein
MWVTPLLTKTTWRFPSTLSEDTNKQATQLTFVLTAIVDKAQSVPENIFHTRHGGASNYPKRNKQY